MNKRTDRKLQGRKPIRVYLSGPIRQTTIEECSDWREEIKQQYPQYDFLDPTRRNFHLDPNYSNDYSTTLTDKAKQIVEADLDDIRQSDILLANVFRYSAGTCQEIFYAKTQNKIVVLVVPQAFKNDIWLKYCADLVTTHFDDAFAFINNATKIQ